MTTDCQWKLSGIKRRAEQMSVSIRTTVRSINNRGNTFKAGIGDATPVGSHLAGASPYGFLDMSGNCRPGS